MKLTASLTEEQFAELPEDIAENYSQSEDGYVLSVEGMTHEDVSGLKTALQKHKDKVAELTQQTETLKTAANESAEQWKQRYLASSRDSVINGAVAAYAGNPEFLAPVLKERVKTEFQNDGSLKFSIKGENGSVLIDKESGEPMTVNQYVASMRKDDRYKAAFKGTGNSGGNSFEASGSEFPMQTAPNMKRGTMTPKQKADYISKYGSDAYQRLPII